MTGSRSLVRNEITGAWALRYLLDRGVLSPADTVLNALSAEDMSVSHRSFCVRVNGEARWFVKRADPVRSRGRNLTVETTLYRLSFTHAGLAQVVPRCWLIDERGDGVIVLDAVRGGALAPDLAWASEPGAASSLRAYGDALARAHLVRPSYFGEPPWLLVALEPRWRNYEWLPPSCAGLLLQLSASTKFRTGFQRARREWTVTGLIHGDIRWANALIDDGSGGSGVRLVDWELACVGDSAWDVGSVLADILAATFLWGNTPERDNPLRAAIPFLAGYQAVAQSDTENWLWLLERSVRLAAIRLVQTLIEQEYAGGGRDLQSSASSLLPWAARFLDNAPEIGTELARGISPVQQQ